MSSSSIRLGVSLGAGASINGAVTVDMSKNKTSVSNTTNSIDNLRIIGYYPDATLHDESSEHRQNYTKVLDDLKALMETAKDSNSTRETIFLIHGPVSTGKSTAARLLMTDKDSKYENRIWINAESPESLEQDFRQLYKRMKALLYPPVPSEQEDFKELLVCVFRNLLTKPTLIVFDNAAIVDIDPSSVFEEAETLLDYLLTLRSTSLTPGRTVPPTAVITTRAVFGPKETHSFSLLSLKSNDHAIPVNEDFVWKQLEADFQLISHHSHGTLALFVFLILSQSGNEKLPMGLLERLCCRCPAELGVLRDEEINVLLNSSDPVSADDVRISLELLEGFSIIESSASDSVNFTDAIKISAQKIAETFSILRELLPSAIARTVEISSPDFPQDTKFFDLDLNEIQLWASSLTEITQNFYQDMVEDKACSPDILMFGVFGNSLERRHDLVMNHIARTSSSSRSTWQSHMEWTRFALGGCTKTNLEFQEELAYVIPTSMMWQGCVKEAVEDYYKIEPQQPPYHFKMNQAEYYLKLGKLAQASTSANHERRSVDYGILLYEPSEVIQAKILMSQGQHLQARHLLQTSLEDVRSAWGRNSCGTAAVEHVLAKTEALYGEFEVALELIEHVLKVRRQFLGVTTIRYIEAIATKVKILELQGDHEMAEYFLSTAEDDFVAKQQYVYADSDVKDHPHFLILRYHQAKLWYRVELHTEALQVVRAIQQLFDETNVYWFKCQLLEVKILQDTGNLKLSEVLLKALIQRTRGVFQGSDNHKALKFKLAYAENLVLQGNFNKAKKLATAVLQSASQNSISLRLKAKEILGKILKREKSVQLVPLLKELVDESIKSSGPFHAQTLKFKMHLMEELIWNPVQDVLEVDELANPVLQFLEERKYERESEVLFSWQCLHVLKLVQYDQLFAVDSFTLTPYLKLKSMGRRIVSTKCSALIKYLEAIVLSRRNLCSEAYTHASELLHFVSTSPVILEVPDTAEITTFLAFLLLKIKGKDAFQEAANLCLSSLSFIIRMYGADHLRTIQAKFNLALCYGISGDSSKAQDLICRVKSAAEAGIKIDYLEKTDLQFVHSIDVDSLEFRIGGCIVPKL